MIGDYDREEIRAEAARLLSRSVISDPERGRLVAQAQTMKAAAEEMLRMLREGKPEYGGQDFPGAGARAVAGILHGEDK